MKTLTAKLVKDTGSQRFYKLSESLTKAFSFGKEKLIKDDFSGTNNRIKEKYRHLIDTDKINIICVSDAHTHIERLVFVGMQFDSGEYGRTHAQIDGVHTMMIHGGDDRAVKPDNVYIRRLARLNGFQFVIN